MTLPLRANSRNSVLIDMTDSLLTKVCEKWHGARATRSDGGLPGLAGADPDDLLHCRDEDLPSPILPVRAAFDDRLDRALDLRFLEDHLDL